MFERGEVVFRHDDRAGFVSSRRRRVEATEIDLRNLGVVVVNNNSGLLGRFWGAGLFAAVMLS